MQTSARADSGLTWPPPTRLPVDLCQPVRERVAGNVLRDAGSATGCPLSTCCRRAVTVSHIQHGQERGSEHAQGDAASAELPSRRFLLDDSASPTRPACAGRGHQECSGRCSFYPIVLPALPVGGQCQPEPASLCRTGAWGMHTEMPTLFGCPQGALWALARTAWGQPAPPASLLRGACSYPAATTQVVLARACECQCLHSFIVFPFPFAKTPVALTPQAGTPQSTGSDWAACRCASSCAWDAGCSSGESAAVERAQHVTA